MHRLLALGCCAVYLVFGFVAGAAHMHVSADHHEESRGLHLNHAHLGEVDDHGPAGHHEHESPESGDLRVDARHVGHHGGDALFLSTTALCSPGSRLRVMPATVAVGATIDPPALVSLRSDDLPDPLGGVPSHGPPLPRAPPV